MKLLRGKGREKIHAFGQSKVGKSSAALDIALFQHRYNLSPHTYWLDTDGAADDMAEVMDDIPNLHLYQSYGTPDTADKWFEEILAYCQEISDRAGPGDLVVFDKSDSAWTVAQWAYDILNYQQTQAEIRMDNRLAGKTGWALYSHSKDDISKWAVVKAQYQRAIQPLTLTCRGDVFFISEEKKVDSNEKDKSRRLMGAQFGGHAPAGEKGLPFQMRSVVRIEFAPNGRRWTSWERLGRKSTEKVEYSEEEGFGLSYLTSCAGWRLEKG